MIRITFKDPTGLLMSQKARFVHSIVYPVYLPTSAIFLFTIASSFRITFTNGMTVIEVTLFFMFSCIVLIILLSSIERWLGFLSKVSRFSIEVGVVAFVVFFVVEFFSFARFVFVVRCLEALDFVTLFMSFLVLLLGTIIPLNTKIIRV